MVSKNPAGATALLLLAAGVVAVVASRRRRQAPAPSMFTDASCGALASDGEIDRWMTSVGKPAFYASMQENPFPTRPPGDLDNERRIQWETVVVTAILTYVRDIVGKLPSCVKDQPHTTAAKTAVGIIACVVVGDLVSDRLIDEEPEDVAGICEDPLEMYRRLNDKAVEIGTWGPLD